MGKQCKVLNVRQVIKIYFPKETEEDISQKAKAESIKNANTTLTGIVAVTFDAGEYKYPCRLWYSVMESVTSYCTIKDWRDLNEQAQNRLHLIIRQMQEAEYVNDELKENNQMAWVQAMNSIHNRAEEIVLHELVYGEDA